VVELNIHCGVPGRHSSSGARSPGGALAAQIARPAMAVPFWHSIVPAPVGRAGTNPEARDAVIHAPLGARNI